MDIKEEVIEIINPDGQKAKFMLLETVEHEGSYYSAFELAEAVDGMEEGDMVIFKLNPDTDEMELVTDEELLDILAEKIEEALEEEFEEQ